LQFAWPNRHKAPGAAPSHGDRRSRDVLAAPGAIVYAVADVHGCFDLLLRLEAMIRADGEIAPDREKIVVMLGDLIDRGPQSAEVLDHVTKAMPPGFRRLVLAGNHETAMLSFLDGADDAGEWLAIGGRETLASYNVPVPRGMLSRRQRQMLAKSAAASVPPEHVDFLRGLPAAISWNGYLFVHAGIRPGVLLENQSDRDLLEIREAFTASKADHGSIVVHGHSPVAAAEILANRIAVDTAAYATGRLAAARLDGLDVNFLIAASRTKS
jgi:serine/threonine protein phosphatase 1